MNLREFSAAQRRGKWISWLSVAAVLIAWEIAGHVLHKSPLQESPIVPPWENVLGPSLLGMADYWKIDQWAPVPELGGERTYLGAGLAIVFHSTLTLARVAAGLTLGAVWGISLGLLISLSGVVRRIVAPTVHFLRMCPLLALIPIFQFWLGANNLAAVIFIGYGAGVFYLVGTLNAVANVPHRYIEYALTLGAHRAAIYRFVLLPAILPELYSTALLTLGLSWTAAIGAEYIGVDSGIGRVLIWAENFTQTGRMVLIALLMVVYVSLTSVFFEMARRRLLRWLA